MKRLSGGLVLLNLTAISLALTLGEVDITDAGILEELTELRQFIDVNRDFSKGFKNLKPIMIEYRSSASKFNGITQANLSFNTDALHMSIGANTIQADGKLLVITINVVYEYTDYVGYTIKSAKLNAYETLADGDATFTGDVGVGGDLSVTGKINNISNPSVKPIYCHPIYIQFNRGIDEKIIAVTMLIFNNSADAFTKSSFWTWMKSLFTNSPNASIMVSGFAGTLPVSRLFNTYGDAVELGVSATDTTSTSYTIQKTDIEDEDTTFIDGVNQIN